jgi:hypothetical protein
MKLSSNGSNSGTRTTLHTEQIRQGDWLTGRAIRWQLSINDSTAAMHKTNTTGIAEHRREWGVEPSGSWADSTEAELMNNTCGDRWRLMHCIACLKRKSVPPTPDKEKTLMGLKKSNLDSRKPGREVRACAKCEGLLGVLHVN